MKIHSTKDGTTIRLKTNTVTMMKDGVVLYEEVFENEEDATHKFEWLIERSRVPKSQGKCSESQIRTNRRKEKTMKLNIGPVLVSQDGTTITTSVVDKVVEKAEFDSEAEAVECFPIACSIAMIRVLTVLGCSEPNPDKYDDYMSRKVETRSAQEVKHD